MCGIAGFVNWTGEPAARELAQAMTDRLQHRGPDGEGHRIFGNTAIGHRRLSIIDVGTGAQPMSNEDGTVWITFNGEIYNYRELRDILVAHGHVFRTQSDTEVMIHGYEQWGEDVVPRLRGIFAFAILDERHHRLLLARDHFGVKPLIYYADGSRFAFASEMKAITIDPAIPRAIDWSAVADYFDYGYVPAPRAILNGFTKLRPGHLMSVDLRRAAAPVQKCYWQLTYGEPSGTNEAALIEQLDQLLQESVRLQLVSDVPLGALLSGGIDSSAVVTVMAEQSPERIKTFSIGFDEQRFSEVQYARKVADLVRSEHHEHTVRANVAELLPRLVYHFDEPFSDASAVPTYYVCEMARRNVTVCLSGDGGDEMFAGYDRYGYCRDQGRADFLPPWIRSAVFGSMAAVYPRSLPGAAAIAGASRAPEDRFVDYMRGQYGRVNGRHLFSESTRARVPQGREDFALLRSAFDDRIADPLNKYLDVDVKTYLPNDILTKTDITSMMNSLEVRVPLLDHKLAEFAARLPADLKLRGRETKYALKQVVKRRLPQEILDRPKMGFGVPMREWVASELREFTHHYLLDQSRASGVLDARVVRQMVEDNEKHLYRSKSGGKLWWALFFEIWYQDVYNASAPGPRTGLARSA
ncbi:MAG TPA: asparagine synthase (glutamine-hydrolyzing) [Vicinamibacterales bacterium]|nr:asparagine synthase (glutamine-hydrolyzing) [Vicinamibacterales bacterium]